MSSSIDDAARSAKRWFDACERFVREYTAGVRRQDLRRLFESEAAAAYDVLRRDQRPEPEPKDGFARGWRTAKVVFLGLSYKLTPARRLLFVGAVVLALAGALGIGPTLISGGLLLFDAPRIWLLLSAASLGFLLTLELVDRIRVRDELEVARQLQRELLPTSAPAVDGYEIVHAYRTANEVGGDYYDFTLLPDGRLVLMVGDASGHGMAAGLLMAIANASIKLALDLDPQPVPVLRMLNRSLCRTGNRRAFMSLFYGLLEPRSGRLEYASAGHPFPLLRRAGGGVEELGDGSLPLGLRPELELNAAVTELAAGDLLLVFSDGLPEALGHDERPFGYERIRAIVAAGGNVEAVRELLLRDFDGHLDGRPLEDDFSLVVVGRAPMAALPPLPS